MEEKINQALVQLEIDLQSLVAARKQVEDTVKASADLQKVVGEYVASVKSLCDGLKAWEDNLGLREINLGRDVEVAISNIKKTCDEIIVLFADKTDSLRISFQNDTKDTLNKFVEQNDILTKRVGELSALREQIKKTAEEIERVKGTLEEILRELKESQEEQDKILEEIKAFVIAINEKTGTILSQISSVCDLVDSKSQTIISDIKSRADSIDSALGNILNTINSISGKSDRIIAKLDTLTSSENKHFKEIEKKFEAQEEFIYRELSIVRKQNVILFSVNALLLLIILGFVLHLVGYV